MEVRKNWLKMVSVVLSIIMMAVVALAGCGKTSEGTSSKSNENKGQKEVVINVFHCWNGGGAGLPDDMVNSIGAKYIREKTGVTLKVKTITTSEVEALNTMFASGDVPDLVNAPYWSTESGEGKVIKKAAVEGMLMPIDKYLNKYPNVKRLLTEGVAKDYREFDLEPKEFKGKHYLIPQQTPRSDADIMKWGYNVFAREDILKALGVNPKDIDTSDKLYELMKKVKAGNFKDANGKPVIVAGTWHNGWSYDQFLTSFTVRSISNFRMENGDLIHWEFSPLEDKKVLYMRKLIAEGLFDPEAFTQTDTAAKEKMAVGKVAIWGAQPAGQFFAQTLYKTHPEMKYVVVGPLKDANGLPHAQVEKHGRAGTPVMFIGKNSKKADAVMRFLNFINSDEGILFAKFGIEGQTYDMVNGKPVFKPEIDKMRKKDPTAFKNLGFSWFGNYIGCDPSVSKYPDPVDPNDWVAMEDQKAKDATPIVIVDKISADYLGRSYPKLDEFMEKTADLDYQKEFQKACFAKSDEEALKILNDYRDKLKKAGIDDYVKYVKEQTAKRNDVGF